MSNGSSSPLASILVVVGVLAGALTIAALLIWLERRLLALWQDRYGPNRVGPLGVMQVLADVIKIFSKEDWIPPFADKPVFILAPAILIVSVLMSFAVVPIAPGIGVDGEQATQDLATGPGRDEGRHERERRRLLPRHGQRLVVGRLVLCVVARVLGHPPEVLTGEEGVGVGDVVLGEQLALHLAAATARRIELANLMTRTRNDWVLRLARSPEFLDVDPDAAIALAGSGRITGMTHGGFGALARSMNMRGFATRDFLGLPISEVFDMDVDDLPRFMRGRPNGERLLRAKNGLVLFASAVAPAVSLRAPTRPEPRLPRALRDVRHNFVRRPAPGELPMANRPHDAAPVARIRRAPRG